MAITRLGISNPAANTDSLIGQADRTSVCSIIVTNKGTGSASVDAWVVPSGQDANSSAWFYSMKNFEIGARNTYESFRFPLVGLDKIYVRASTSNISFSLNVLYDVASRNNVYVQSSQPNAPISGDIWFDTDNNRILVWNDTDVEWQEPTTAEVDDLRNDLNALDDRVVSLELGLGIFD